MKKLKYIGGYVSCGDFLTKGRTYDVVESYSNYDFIFIKDDEFLKRDDATPLLISDSELERCFEIVE